MNGTSPAITTSSTTASVFNTNATTVNIAGAGTTVSLGASTGTTTVNNSLTASGGISGANAKTMTVASGYNGSTFNSTSVIMVASQTGASTPSTRPNGATGPQPGDIWISW